MHNGTPTNPSLSNKLTSAQFWRPLVPKSLAGKVFLLVLPVVCYMCFFYVYPLIRILALSFFSPDFTLAHYLSFFQNKVNLFSLHVTFKISSLVTFICLLMGYPLAYYLSSIPIKKANVLLILVLIPLWTSLLVRTFSWIMLLGRNGIINQSLLKLGLIQDPLRIMYNTFGLTVGMVHVMIPFMILSLYSVMKGIDRNLLKAAQNLGATPFYAFRKIFLPLSVPGILAGSIMVFVISIGFFVTPVLLGGPRELMISMVIEQAISVLLNWGFGSAASFILLFLTLGIFLFSGKLIGFDKLWGKRQ